MVEFLTGQNDNIADDKIDDLEKLRNIMNISHESYQKFVDEVMKYCKENLARVELYIPSPYVSRYILDQVLITLHLM